MKSGLLTATCPNTDLRRIAEQAATIGFESVELGAWPNDMDDTDQGDIQFDPNLAVRNESHAKKIVKVFDEQGLSISALAYYPNNLDPDSETRQENQEHLKTVIQAAAIMDIDLVGTFIGRDPSLPLDEALEDAKSVWPSLLEFAESYDVKLMIENCPMDHYGHLGTNLFYSPATWTELFDAFDSEYLGLNYDPSHLYWLRIDHVKQLERFSDRIFQVHAKDTTIYDERVDELGILADRRITDNHWWEFRLPGLGEIDWGTFMDELYHIGYDGPVILEHEDPRFMDDAKKFWQGARIGHQSIVQYM